MVGYLNQYTQGLSEIWRRSLDPLRAKPTKWSNTLKQFAGCCRRIIYVFDHFVGLALKGIVSKGSGSQKSQTISPKSLVSSKQRSNIHSYECNLALLFLDLN